MKKSTVWLIGLISFSFICWNPAFAKSPSLVDRLVDKYGELPETHPTYEHTNSILQSLVRVSYPISALSPRLVILPLKVVQAQAVHPETIVLSQGMVESWKDEPEKLAFIIGHEYQHLLQGDQHPMPLQGWNSAAPTGQPLDSDCSSDYWRQIRKNEADADRMGMLLMTLAGHDPNRLFEQESDVLVEFYEKSGLDVYITRESCSHDTPRDRKTKIRMAAAEGLLKEVEYFRFGLSALAAGHLDTSIEAFNTFQSFFGSLNLPAVNNNLGVAYLLKAQEELKVSLPVSPMLVQSTNLQKLQNFLNKQQRGKRISPNLRKALQHFKKNTENPLISKSISHFNYALALLLERQFRDNSALYHMRQAADACPLISSTSEVCQKPWQTLEWMRCIARATGACSPPEQATLASSDIPRSQGPILRKTMLHDVSNQPITVSYHPKGVLYQWGSHRIWSDPAQNRRVMHLLAHGFDVME